MASGKEWKSLFRETADSVGSDDVRGLYTVDWREATAALTAEHRGAIEGERRRPLRSLKVANAFLYGLTSRLAPRRRLLFAFSVLLILWSLFRLLGEGDPAEKAPGSVVLLLVASLLLVFLVGMELVDKLRFRDELVLARELQADLVPQELPAAPPFELGAYNRVANTVGGDLYEFTPLPGGRLSVLFGDASGHGMAAGLVMAVAHTAYRAQVDLDPDPIAVANALNRLLCRTGSCRAAGPRSFFAGVTLLVEPDGSFSAVVSGNPPVLLLGTDGRVRDRIGKGAYPLGVRPDLKAVLETGRLGPGESLVLHSDGLPEARNPSGEEFGDARVEAVLSRSAGRPAREQVEALCADLKAFLGPAVPEDDVSIAVVTRATAPSGLLPLAPVSC